MLTLFEGGFHSTLHKDLIDEIKRATERSGRVYLIVPEQQTVNAECEMSEALPASAPLHFEVTNFTRFTNTVFREIGGVSGEYCSGAARSLVMWRALTELSPMLSITGGRKTVSDGTVRKALAAVGEMQSLGISADMLGEVVKEGAADRRLSEKLRDLSLIYSLYSRLLGERFIDNSSDAITLAGMLEGDASFLVGCEIFVDGFTSFTEPQYRLLGAIMKHAPLTVTLKINRASESFEFAEVMGARRKLTALAANAGCDTVLRKSTPQDLERNPVLGEICDLLWHSEGEIDNDSLQYLTQNPESIRIFEAANIYDECEFAAADIKRRIMSGDRYSDIAVIARRVDGYLGVLDAAFDTAGIPYFMSRVTDISSVPLVKLISIAYKIINTGYRKEDILTYLKCGICPVSADESDRFELYVEKWRIDGRRFTDGITWNMSPRGYEAMREGDAELLCEIDATRAKIIEPLLDFELATRDAATVREHADALLALLASLEAEEAMAKRADELLLLGDGTAAEESRRAWPLLCEALDTVVDILGEVNADAPSFISQLLTALSDASVGRIPALEDVVTVGSADMLRVEGKKHVYLLGVNSGEFPAGVSESSYFTDREKLALMELGLPTEPDLEVKGARELYSFSRAFSAGCKTVTVSYSSKTPMLTPLLPAEVIGRIGEITRGYAVARRISSVPLMDRLYSEAAVLEALTDMSDEERISARAALSDVGWAEKLEVRDGSIRNNEMSLDDEALGIIYKNDLYLSQTRIDKFLGCPMSYFCKYNLRLGENEPAELGSNIIGSFVHAVIEGFFTELERRNVGAEGLSEEDRAEITLRAAERYAADLIGEAKASARTRVAISRLARATRPVVDGLCEELSGCKYKPTFFELKTDAYDSTAPDHLVIDRNGGRIIVRGTIDRVDTYKSGEDVYVRVIDYKTGYNDFVPSKLGEGEYLQMFLYLKAIADTKKPEFLERVGVGEGGRIIPAGVIYVKTKVSDSTVRFYDDNEAASAAKQLQERDGMLLDAEESISAMNPDFIPPEVKRREPLRYTEEGWQQIEQTLIEVTRSVADGMCSGNITATPATKGGRNCKWCPYKAICRSAVIKNDF